MILQLTRDSRFFCNSELIDFICWLVKSWSDGCANCQKLSIFLLRLDNLYILSTQEEHVIASLTSNPIVLFWETSTKYFMEADFRKYTKSHLNVYHIHSMQSLEIRCNGIQRVLPIFTISCPQMFRTPLLSEILWLLIFNSLVYPLCMFVCCCC